MRFCSKTAEEMANALLDAVEIAKETGKPCYICKVGSCMVAIDDVDTDFISFQVDPPLEEPPNQVEVAA